MQNVDLFDTCKAKQLMETYKAARKEKESKVLSDLISWQEFFGECSIIGANIGLTYFCNKKTIKKVLYDMGYKLDTYSAKEQIDLQGVNHGKETYFSFSKKEA